MSFIGLYLKKLGCMLDWWLPLEQFQFCSILEDPRTLCSLNLKASFKSEFS